MTADAAPSDDPVVLALLAAADGEAARAHDLLDGDADPLALALRAGLARPADDVYVDPSAFTRFIATGENPALYAATIGALRSHWSEVGGALLDIGCGDGRVVAAMVGPGDEVELCEPAGAMRAAARAAVEVTGASVTREIATPIERDVETWEPARRVARTQATFALHNLDPATRVRCLTHLAEHVDRLALVEFDIPAFADRSVDHAEYCARTYRRGVEQHADPSVIDGFLVPVLLGQFLPGRVRHTHEQPVAAWAAELEEAGFGDVRVEPVHDGFWWGPAALVSGSGRV